MKHDVCRVNVEKPMQCSVDDTYTDSSILTPHNDSSLERQKNRDPILRVLNYLGMYIENGVASSAPVRRVFARIDNILYNPREFIPKAARTWTRG